MVSNEANPVATCSGYSGKMEATEKGEPAEVSEVKPPEEFVEFKKPIFVGKIGRLPRKLVKPEVQDAAPTVGSSGAKTDIVRKPGSVTSNSKPVKDKIKQKYALVPSVLKEKTIPLPYKEPKWSGLPPPESGYCFEVLKSGTILESIDLTKKPFHVFGRLCLNDIVMAHPTISRHHAVIQYKAVETEDKRPLGFYLYDLGSSHGSFVNKVKVKPNHYARVRVGHLIKLGCSTRQYILQGPEDDKEAESELSLTEMKRQRLARKLELLKGGSPEMEEGEGQAGGISWGMADDAEDEPDLADNPYAVSTNEELYLDDPKKTLRGFFEREGCVLEYDCQERGIGQFVCRVELPVEDARGNPVVAEVIHKGKKKDAVVQCALEACRIIDRHGLLRQAKHESRKRKSKDWKDEDYYDSDEDTFLDRTGAIERKREGRMQRGGQGALPKEASTPLTYPQLVDKCSATQSEISALEARLAQLRAPARAPEVSADGDEDVLDQFMRGLGKQSAADKADISKTKLEIQKLKLELAKTERLAEIAKPADLPALVPQTAPAPETSRGPIVKKTSNSVIIGKRIKLKNREKTPYKKPKAAAPLNDGDEFVEELDSDEEAAERIEGKSKESGADRLDKVEPINSVDDVGSGKEGEDSKDEKEDKGGGKVYGPMRPPTDYVVPASYFEQDTDRDLPEITDETEY